MFQWIEVKGNTVFSFSFYASMSVFHTVKMYRLCYNGLQMSLENGPREKVCGLLRVTLTSLGRLLEVASMAEFGKLAEEVLQYLKSVTALLPTLTVQCGQQVQYSIYTL